MGKTLKNIGVIILFIFIIFVIFSFIYNAYIKYLIKEEEKRIADYAKYEFVLDNEYKVRISYAPDTVDVSFSTIYNIDFENNTVEILHYSTNHMPIPYNKFVLWGENKSKLEQLRGKQCNMEKIKIEDNNKRKLENLIVSVLDKNKTVEEYNKEHKDIISSIPYQVANPSTYLVSTINKTKVVMDDPEQINLFFELIGKKKTNFN